MGRACGWLIHLSLEKIERDIRELDAIRHYPEVKTERDDLLTKVQVLQGRVSELESHGADALSRGDRLEAELNSKGKQYQTELEARDEHLSRVNDQNSILQANVKELEEAKTLADGKTLSEAIKAFKVARNREIAQEAEILFIERKVKWEREQKPREASRKAYEMLNQIIDTLRGSEPHAFPKDLLDLMLPEKVSAIMKDEMNRRINTEFKRRVEEESIIKTKVKLDKLKREEWPKWLKANVGPKAREFSEQIYADSLRSINRTFSMTCDQCGTRQSHEMTPERIAYLLSPDPLGFLPGRGLVECINPTCIEWGFRHHLRVQLKDIIFEYLIQPSRAQES